MPGERYIPVLDHAKPPILIGESQAKVMTLDDLTRRVETTPPNWIVNGVREILNVPDEEELDVPPERSTEDVKVVLGVNLQLVFRNPQASPVQNHRYGEALLE